MTAAGAAIGFAGLVLFMNPGLIDWRDPPAVIGNALLIAAAIFWALGSCLYRQRRWRSPFWVQTWWQLAVSVLPVAAVVAGWGAAARMRCKLCWSVRGLQTLTKRSG